MCVVLTDSAQFSAVEMIHRRVSQDWEEPLVVNIDGAFYVLPPSSEFILSNLQDLCDHLHLEFSGRYTCVCWTAVVGIHVCVGQQW